MKNFTVEELNEFLETEEYTQLDELAKKTLASYIKKAAIDGVNNASEGGYKLGGNAYNVYDTKGEQEGNEGAKNDFKAAKRTKGIAKAVNKLVKEALNIEKIFLDIEAGNLADAKTAVESALSTKVSEKLDAMKQAIAGALCRESIEIPTKGTTSIEEGCISGEDKLKAVQNKAKSVPKKAPKLKDGEGKVVDEFKPVKEGLDGAKRDSNEGVYHNTYREALEHAYSKAAKKGYEIHDEDYHKDTAFVDPKPSAGKTKSLHFPLTKNGVLQKKQMHVQVYNRGQEKGSKYELNHYIS